MSDFPEKDYHISLNIFHKEQAGFRSIMSLSLDEKIRGYSAFLTWRCIAWEMPSNSGTDRVPFGELLSEVSGQRLGGLLGLGWGDSGNRI